MSRRRPLNDAAEPHRRGFGRPATVSSPFPGNGPWPWRPRLARALPYALAGGRGAPGVVSGERSLAALARDDGSLRDPRQRGDAAADAGRARDPALATVARALADRRRARRRVARRGDRRVAGPRLQPARPEPAPCGGAGSCERLARGPHRAPRRRPVHRGRGRQLRLRQRRAARRHERAARTGAHRLRVRPCLRTGPFRPRRDRVPRARPPLRALPARGALPLARLALRAGAQAGRVRRLFPAAQSRGAARRGGRVPPGDDDALASLARDGLVVLRDGAASLPV